MLWCAHKRGLSWLPSEEDSTSSWKSQMQIFTPKQWTEAADPCDWIREKLEEAEDDGAPIGRTAVSTSLDPMDLSGTEPTTRQHTLADMRLPTHIQQRTSGSELSQGRCTQVSRDWKPQGVERSDGARVKGWRHLGGDRGRGGEYGYEEQSEGGLGRE